MEVLDAGAAVAKDFPADDPGAASVEPKTFDAAPDEAFPKLNAPAEVEDCAPLAETNGKEFAVGLMSALGKESETGAVPDEGG